MYKKMVRRPRRQDIFVKLITNNFEDSIKEQHNQVAMEKTLHSVLRSKVTVEASGIERTRKRCRKSWRRFRRCCGFPTVKFLAIYNGFRNAQTRVSSSFCFWLTVVSIDIDFKWRLVVVLTEIRNILSCWTCVVGSAWHCHWHCTEVVRLWAFSRIVTVTVHWGYNILSQSRLCN